jgi:hypothetical protein
VQRVSHPLRRTSPGRYEMPSLVDPLVSSSLFVPYR